MTTRTELKEITHEKVMAAAGELFAAHGYRDTTIRDIAARARVSVGSVMAVGDKQTLLVAIFDRAIARIHQDRAAEGAPHPIEGDSEAGRVIQLLDPFFSLFAGQVELAREYGAILMSGNHQSVLFGELGDALRAEIAYEARSAGFSDSTSEDAARTAYFAYLGTLFFWAARGTIQVSQPRDDFMSVLDHVFSKGRNPQ